MLIFLLIHLLFFNTIIHYHPSFPYIRKQNKKTVEINIRKQKDIAKIKLLLLIYLNLVNTKYNNVLLMFKFVSTFVQYN